MNLTANMTNEEYKDRVLTFKRSIIVACICISIIGLIIGVIYNITMESRYSFKCDYITEYGCTTACGCAWSPDFGKCVSGNNVKQFTGYHMIIADECDISFGMAIMWICVVILIIVIIAWAIILISSAIRLYINKNRDEIV